MSTLAKLRHDLCDSEITDASENAASHLCDSGKLDVKRNRTHSREQHHQVQFALGGGALGRESECNTAQTCEGNTADYILDGGILRDINVCVCVRERGRERERESSIAQKTRRRKVCKICQVL